MWRWWRKGWSIKGKQKPLLPCSITSTSSAFSKYFGSMTGDALKSVLISFSVPRLLGCRRVGKQVKPASSVKATLSERDWRKRKVNFRSAISHTDPSLNIVTCLTESLQVFCILSKAGISASKTLLRTVLLCFGPYIILWQQNESE